MKRIVTSFLVVILSIVLLIILPFVFKNKQEEYIDFSEVTETVDNSTKDDETLRIGLISVTGDNKIDVAFLSTGAYSLYEDKDSLELLARPNRGKTYYHPIVITKKDSNINNIEDLKNQSFAFVDTYSYSGYLAMNDYFKKNGMSVNKFFSNSYFTHSHEESINQVANGTVKAAIVDDWALQYLYNNFPDTAFNIKIIKTFPEVATGPVVTHKNYEEKDKLKQILISINQDANIKNTLSQLQIEKYEETKVSDYPNLISED